MIRKLTTAVFLYAAALTAAGSDFRTSKTCRTTPETTLGSPAGTAVGTALKSIEESCSLRRAAWSFSSSVEFSTARVEGCCLSSDGRSAAGGLREAEAGGTWGALRRLARGDPSEEEVAGAEMTVTSGIFATDVTGAAAF